MITGRKDCTTGAHRCTPKSRREALYCQGSHSQMTRTEIAEAMGVNVSTLGSWLDPEAHDRIPDERLEHLLHLTDDNAAYVRYFSGLQDMVVYDPKKDVSTTRMVREFAELLEAIDARVDGTSADEADRVEREGRELIGAVRKAIDDARRAAAGGGKLTVIK